MAIHYINAYDDVDGAAVIVDCCEHYGDPTIIHTLLLRRLRSFSTNKDKDLLPNARYAC
jgi:carlactone synthase/all-trans-10'-apo-beta-carotenal 13,14-cleaving dioxygenase